MTMNFKSHQLLCARACHLHGQLTVFVFFSPFCRFQVFTRLFSCSLSVSLSLSSLQRILAQGSCQIDHAIDDLEGAEAYDTAMIMVEFEDGKTAVIDVCRQAPYG